MRIPARRVGAHGAVAALAMAIAVIAGCGDGSTPQQPATTTTTDTAATTTATPATTTTTDTAATTTAAPATTTTTDTAATTTETAATTTAAPATTPATETAPADTGIGSASLEAPAEAGLGDIEADTLWQEVFDVFTASEQSCIRDAVDDALLETLLGARVLSEDAELPVAEVFACLRPETSGAIWISTLITGIEEEENLELSSAERSCMREQLAGLLPGEDSADMAALITQDDSAMSDDGVKMLLTSTVVLFECVPDFFIREILSEAGINPDELSDDETSCLRELAADLDDLDWPAILAASRSEENYGSLFGTIESTGLATRATVLFECVPDSFLQMILSGAGIDPDELSDDEASCLRELITDLGELDWPEISAVGGSEENYGSGSPFEVFFETMFAVPECLPERSLDGWTA